MTDHHDEELDQRGSCCKWVALFLLVLPVLYVLSYPPVMRYFSVHRPDTWWRGQLTDFPDGRNVPAYRPVDWLIDNTMLRTPLLAWGAVWGVESDMRMTAREREAPSSEREATTVPTSRNRF